MDSVTTFFKEENDFLYRRGFAKGMAKAEAKGEEIKTHTMIENLIKFGLTDEQVAEVVEVDLAYVKKIRTELNKK
jgi:hypothetical protein